MQDVRVDRGTDCGSDYFLLTAKMQLKFKILIQAEKQMIFNSTKLKDTDTIQKHLVEVCNRSAYLEKTYGSRRQYHFKFLKAVFHKFYFAHF